jgi:hypothetical protein
MSPAGSRTGDVHCRHCRARTLVRRKYGSYILYNYSGGFSWYLFGSDNRLQHDIAGNPGTAAGATSSAP